MPLLYTEMIRKAIKEGSEYVDLGRTELSNEGLVAFKERFGAVANCVQYWRFGSAIREQSPVSQLLARAGRFICARTPVGLLPRIGTFLYPHVG
jgi:lipid II:glycine glycyltransferase (peptidoglycan interpeptide bridge formation enzyme)